MTPIIMNGCSSRAKSSIQIYEHRRLKNPFHIQRGAWSIILSLSLALLFFCKVIHHQFHCTVKHFRYILTQNCLLSFLEGSLKSKLWSPENLLKVQPNHLQSLKFQNMFFFYWRWHLIKTDSIWLKTIFGTKKQNITVLFLKFMNKSLFKKLQNMWR